MTDKPPSLIEALSPTLVRFARIARLMLGVTDAHVVLFEPVDGLWRASESEPRPSGPAVEMVRQSGEMLWVGDSQADPAFASLPMMMASEPLRFHAAAPVRLSDQRVIGVLHAFDTRPHEFSARHAACLKEIAAAIADACEPAAAVSGAVEAHAEPTPPPQLVYEPPPQVGEGPPGVRVLAAEDNAMNAKVLRAILGQAGIDPVIVANGAEAVAAWETGRWDVILMDVQMPVMDGPTATRTIRERERSQRRAPTPIIALTANAMTHQVDEYLGAGMDEFVSKPIDVRRLFAAIQTALSAPSRAA